jgi:hypothetical protein
MDSGLTPSKLDKRARLVVWALVHRVPVEADITANDVARVCKWFGLGFTDWEVLKRAAPDLAQKVEAKRGRRRAWAVEHGSVPDGWTPPDPLRPNTKQPITRKKRRKTRRESRAHNQRMHELIRRVYRMRER